MAPFLPSHNCHDSLTEVDRPAPDKVVRQCQVCGRKHYEMSIDQGNYQLKAS